MSASSEPTLPPHSEAFLAEINAQLKQQLDTVTRELSYARLKIQSLEERLRQRRIAKYGPASEKLSTLQLELLEEEPGVSGEKVQLESEREALPRSSAARPHKPHPGRQTLPAGLPRVENILACAPEQRVCARCGAETEVIGYDQSEVLNVRPAEYFVEVTKREKRVCKHCADQGVAMAPLARRILEKSLVADRILVDTIVNKYTAHLPLYRQSALLERDCGIEISRATMCGWVMQVGEMLTPLVAAMRKELLASGYIQADETPVLVQTHDKRGHNHRAYLWQYGTPEGGVVFDFRMSRGREGPREFLGDFAELLQTDDYNAYERGIGGPGLVHACCWSHARRHFADAVKLNKRDAASLRAVELINDLFAIDAETREQKMDIAARHRLRQAKAPAALDQIQTHILNMRKTLLPAIRAGHACQYTLKLWEKLTCFLDYPRFELSNNLVENSMRFVAVGRSNWIHIGSPEAGPRVAAILSAVESCRRFHINIRNYFMDILPGLADVSIQRLVGLTPAAWAAAHPQS